MSEWISRFTAETTTNEIVENPSALNPYPELVQNSSFEVGDNERMPTFGANFHVYVRYDEYGVVRGQLPTLQAVEIPDIQPPAELDEAYEKRWQDPESIASAQFCPVADLMDKEAPHLARRWLYWQDQDVVKGLMRALVEKNQQDPGRNYVRFVLETYNELLADGQPGPALAVAMTLRRDSIFTGGERNRIQGMDTLERYAIPGLLEPNLHKDPEKLMPKGSTEDILSIYNACDEIGRQALLLLELSLTQAAVAAARSQISHAEVVRKIKLLEEYQEKQSVRLIGGLHRTAQEAPSIVHSTRGVNLATISHQELSEHLLARLLEK